MADAYEEQYGVRPTAEEIRVAVADYSERVVATNALDVELIVHSFNSAVEHLGKYLVQRVEIEQFSTVRLFIGDSPAVVSQGGRVSAAHKPVAIGDASEVFMPLSPTVAAALSVEPVPNKSRLAPAEAQRMNKHTLNAARRHFVARTAADVRARLGKAGASDQPRLQAGER